MHIQQIEPPWEVETPRGKADVMAIIDYSQESYVYFLVAQRVSGEFWIFRNDKIRLCWNESTGLGKRSDGGDMSKFAPSAPTIPKV